ncbi:MAG: type II toxin-antitoxin system VapC family toxin [Candidatus Riflebacteria bacterium]|nr:type II toxin-antitoxin system VapC family toxin [Candidatus Riflebacteria bacterium]
MFDTDVLIDLSRNEPSARSTVLHLEKNHTFAISIITKMEMVIGCRNKKELRELDSLLSLFRLLMINETISQLGCDLLEQYRLSHGLLLPDSLIAATAKSFSLPLVSKNQRDFTFIDNLKLLPYPVK